MNKEGDHYLQLEAVIDTSTTDSNRPSAKKFPRTKDDRLKQVDYFLINDQVHIINYIIYILNIMLYTHIIYVLNIIYCN